MTTYDFILQGHEATLDNAIEHANGQDWQSIEKTDNNNLPYLDYIGTYNGIEVWHCYAGDYYIFTDEDDLN